MYVTLGTDTFYTFQHRHAVCFVCHRPQLQLTRCTGKVSEHCRKNCQCAFLFVQLLVFSRIAFYTPSISTSYCTSSSSDINICHTCFNYRLLTTFMVLIHLVAFYVVYLNCIYFADTLENKAGVYTGERERSIIRYTLCLITAFCDYNTPEMDKIRENTHFLRKYFCYSRSVYDR